jgi:hypothetical protein
MVVRFIICCNCRWCCGHDSMVVSFIICCNCSTIESWP